MSNPVLIEVTRGERVESFHRGAVAVSRGPGPPLLAFGDVTRPVYARSAIKMMQALPLIETGAADQFGFGDAEIALACGSHAGTERHVAVARGMVAKLGLDQACLACGPAAPLATKAAFALAARGEAPTPLHHNCSGKHAGMLASALATGAATAGYWEARHPVQHHVQAVVSDLTGVALEGDVCGIDGCCVPTWALSLDTLARAFARIATGEGLSADRNAAVRRLLGSCWAEPELVSGRGRADTVVMAALPGRIYLKNGAEGVYCGALPELGLGFALKIDDGAQRACAGAVMPLVERMIPQARGLVKRSVLMTAKGIEVGQIRSSAAYERALDGLRL
jgi:L-asparaginase II